MKSGVEGEVDFDRLRRVVIEEWRAFRSHGWEFAELVAFVRRHEVWRYWQDVDGLPFGSMMAWARADLGVTNRATLSRYASVGDLVLDMSEEEARRWRSHHVFNVYEVLPIAVRDRDRAIELLESGRPQSELRRVVRGEAGVEEEGLRVIKLTVTEGVYLAWQAARNILRVMVGSASGKPYPQDSDIVEAICGMVETAPEFRVIWGRDGGAVELSGELWEQIRAGAVECVLCGGVANLQRHHVIPRSHGGVDDQGREVLVWLCAGCHVMVTERRGGYGWQELAEDLAVGRPRARGLRRV